VTLPRVLLALASALLGASLVGATLLLRGPADPGPSPAGAAPAGVLDDGSRAELEALRSDLEREAEERVALEYELAALQAEVARLSGAPGRESQNGPRARKSAPGTAGRTGKGFDEASLVTAGMEAEEARWLHERYDAYELARLFVIDRAQREGAGARRRSELARLETELRDELGEERYDGLLYAQGKDNRVVVSDVLKRSPAEDADIRESDVVLSYDGVRVFSPMELRRATMGGVAGESVPVELQRGDAVIRLFVPRGPMGITLISESRAPVSQG
jgi:hypothetical protein